MVLYRRNRVEGGTYFFTVTLRDRSSDALIRHVDLLREAFREVRKQRPFTINATGSFAYRLDLAGRRCRLFRTVARDKIAFYSFVTVGWPLFNT